MELYRREVYGLKEEGERGIERVSVRERGEKRERERNK